MRDTIQNRQINKSVSAATATVLIAMLLVISSLYPLVYSMLSGFKTLEEFQKYPPFALPKTFYLDNFVHVLTKSSLFTYLSNSAIIMMLVVFFVLLLSSLAAFALEKMGLRFKNQVLGYFLLGLMIPLQVCLVPLFLAFSHLNLTNTYLGVVLPQVAFGLPLSIYLFKNFYQYLSNEVLEASIIDGCNALQMFVRIVLPMSINIIVTLAILRGVFSWNDFIFAYTFTSQKDMQTVTLGLRDFVGDLGYTDWGLTFSTITLTILPSFVLYFFLGKYMVSGLADGAVKE